MRAGVGHSAIAVMRLIMESVLGTTVWGCCITPVVKPTAVRWCVFAQTKQSMDDAYRHERCYISHNRDNGVHD